MTDNFIISEIIGNNSLENDHYIEEEKITDPTLKLIVIHITLSENYISSIQFELSNSKSFYLTSLIGHKTNRKCSFYLNDNESVKTIVIYYDKFLQGMYFINNKGICSPLFGSKTLKEKKIEIKGELINFGGTYGNHITSIYFISRNNDVIFNYNNSENEKRKYAPEEFDEILGFLVKNFS